MAVNPIQVQRRLISVEEYEQMIKAGVFGEDDRLELIEGDILAMSPTGGAHIQVVNRLNRLLVRRLEDRAVVSVQNPIRLSNSEPQPALALLRPEVDERPAEVPQAADVLLLIEVADTTAGYDRAIKLPLYATDGIPEVWLVDVQEQVIEVYQGAAAGRYRQSRTASGSDTLNPQALPDLQVRVSEIFAPS